MQINNIYIQRICLQIHRHDNRYTQSNQYGYVIEDNIVDNDYNNEDPLQIVKSIEIEILRIADRNPYKPNANPHAYDSYIDTLHRCIEFILQLEDIQQVSTDVQDSVTDIKRKKTKTNLKKP